MVGARARLQARRGRSAAPTAAKPTQKRARGPAAADGRSVRIPAVPIGGQKTCGQAAGFDPRMTRTRPPVRPGRPVLPGAMQATWLAGQRHNGTLTACGMRVTALFPGLDPPDLPAGGAPARTSRRRQRAVRRFSLLRTGRAGARRLAASPGTTPRHSRAAGRPDTPIRVMASPQQLRLAPAIHIPTKRRADPQTTVRQATTRPATADPPGLTTILARRIAGQPRTQTRGQARACPAGTAARGRF